jgi:hypothetical protein
MIQLSLRATDGTEGGVQGAGRACLLFVVFLFFFYKQQTTDKGGSVPRMARKALSVPPVARARL